MGAQTGQWSGGAAGSAPHEDRPGLASEAKSMAILSALKDLDPVYVSQDSISSSDEASELNCLRASLAQERAARVAMEELVTKLDLEVQELRQQLFAERTEMEAILLASDVEKEVIASNWQVIANRNWQLEAKVAARNRKVQQKQRARQKEAWQYRQTHDQPPAAWLSHEAEADDDKHALSASEPADGNTGSSDVPAGSSVECTEDVRLQAQSSLDGADRH
ncbi:unnamed protein product [Symbiodinium necroappetens]|uniref:Uncharacterized protein n=1 Tax=Symbiodinium necroappetens TaxID=1628268 RepID=A0A813AQG5_9DINO|nr:unnamed protein product [Symbiodinium necroappetens]